MLQSYCSIFSHVFPFFCCWPQQPIYSRRLLLDWSSMMTRETALKPISVSNRSAPPSGTSATLGPCLAANLIFFFFTACQNMTKVAAFYDCCLLVMSMGTKNMSLSAILHRWLPPHFNGNLSHLCLFHLNWKETIWLENWNITRSIKCNGQIPESNEQQWRWNRKASRQKGRRLSAFVKSFWEEKKRDTKIRHYFQCCWHAAGGKALGTFQWSSHSSRGPADRYPRREVPDSRWLEGKRSKVWPINLFFLFFFWREIFFFLNSVHYWTIILWRLQCNSSVLEHDDFLFYWLTCVTSFCCR